MFITQVNLIPQLVCGGPNQEIYQLKNLFKICTLKKVTDCKNNPGNAQFNSRMHVTYILKSSKLFV